MELESVYPAQHYDMVTTGRWSDDAISFVTRILERYLTRNNYPRVIAHVPEGGYGEICGRVDSATKIPFEYTVVDHPTTTESIANLTSALENEARYSRCERQHDVVKAVADYQFGANAGEVLFAMLISKQQVGIQSSFCLFCSLLEVGGSTSKILSKQPFRLTTVRLYTHVK